MENTTPEIVNQPKSREEINGNNKEASEVVEQTREPGAFSVIKDEKNSDSDANSEELSSNDEQNHVNSGSSCSSQFYESDSKLDYAVKIDDNDTLSDIDDIKTDTASADSEDSALGSLPPDGIPAEREEEAQDRSDGSDSGIGSETQDEPKESSFNLALPSTSGLNKEKSSESTLQEDKTQKDLKNDDLNEVPNPAPSAQFTKPQKSNLKRKCDNENNDQPPTKRKKEGIRFDNVTVYYFPRAQGFSCVPSQGGSTLGMEWAHSHVQKFTLPEHALEQRRLHRQILQQLKSERHTLQGAALSSSEDSDTEEEASDISESELDLDSYYFLQPVPTRQRRALLRAAGVRKIEGYEKDECRDIRSSREFCGCACKGTCNPESCTCSLGGIKCQVDRINFPCGCTRDGCKNTSGRIEFNPVRVRTHFIHTLMRIGLEKKNEENLEAAKRQWAAQHAHTVSSTAAAAAACANTAYDRERCHSHELRDVSLSPRVEVESCVNNGSFSNVHCEVNATTPVAQSNMQEDAAYMCVAEHTSQKNMTDVNMMHFENRTNMHNHADAYTHNIMSGKGPPYSAGNALGYGPVSNNMQRFTADLNFAYEHHTDTSHFKGTQSYSATSFEEFAHNSQMSMFSHYGHMYVPEYMHKPSAGVHDHAAMQYHAHALAHVQAHDGGGAGAVAVTHQSHNPYDMYKSTECGAGAMGAELKNESHYTTLMTMPYQNSNNLQTLDNDENWFSQNTLLTLDHSEADQTTQDAPEAQPPAPAPAPPTPTPVENSDTTENFGELIKNTMVESVTV